MFRKQIIVTAISLIVGTAVYANQKPVGFKQVDSNSDGAISYSEAEKSLNIDSDQFAKTDTVNSKLKTEVTTA